MSDMKEIIGKELELYFSRKEIKITATLFAGAVEFLPVLGFFEVLEERVEVENIFFCTY